MNEEQLNKKQLIIFSIICLMVASLFLGSGLYISYNNYISSVKIEKKNELKQQMIRLNKLKETLPYLKDTKYYKMSNIPKISLDRVQQGGATLTFNFGSVMIASMNQSDTCSPDYSLDVDAGDPNTFPGIPFSFSWFIIQGTPNSYPVNYIASSGYGWDDDAQAVILNNDNANGWNATPHPNTLAGSYTMHCVEDAPGVYSYDSSSFSFSQTLGIPSTAPAGVYYLANNITNTGYNLVSVSDSLGGWLDGPYLEFIITPPCPTLTVSKD